MNNIRTIRSVHAITIAFLSLLLTGETFAEECKPTIQQYFKDNGYYTLSGGKVLHHGFNPLSHPSDQHRQERMN
jgi:hypothetical protein